MQGRITEEQLPVAEQSFPGICQLYREMTVKPRTFLQLLWIYEEACAPGEAGCEPSLRVVAEAGGVG